jgi:putative ABC transport system substrate-binding protein
MPSPERGQGMRRREFLGALGGAAAWSTVARAQERMRRVGILMGYAEGDPEAQQRVTILRQALENLGWTNDRNVQFEIRWAEANPERRRTQAVEMAKGKPDVIVANTAPVAAALKQATTTIPIVLAAGADPVVSGLVANLSRPGGNITGFTVTEPSLGGKWLELLKELSPSMSRAGVVHDPANPARSQYTHSIQTMNAKIKTDLRQLDVRDGSGISKAIDEFAHSAVGGAVGALLILPGAATGVYRRNIIEAANRNRLPAIYPTRFYAVDGGLASYGADYQDVFRRSASYVDRILRGENAGDLPIQLPTKFELVVNLKTAKAMGLKISESFLLRADEVIE